MIRVDVKRLKSNLATSGLQQQNQALYQVIIQLIDAAQQLIATLDSSSGSGTDFQPVINSILAGNFLTSLDESATFANSRQLLAGQNIAFDDSIMNERTVSTGNWSVLTNGDPVTPELIFAGGDVVMTYTP